MRLLIIRPSGYICYTSDLANTSVDILEVISKAHDSQISHGTNHDMTKMVISVRRKPISKSHLCVFSTLHTHTHAHIHENTHMHAHTYKHIQKQHITHTYTCVCVCVCTYIHTYIHTNTHSCTYTHAHTQSEVNPLQ